MSEHALNLGQCYSLIEAHPTTPLPERINEMVWDWENKLSEMEND